MRLWIINQYETTPHTGIGGRWHHIAAVLAQAGHDVRLFSAKHHHLKHISGLSRTMYRAEAVPTLARPQSRGMRRMLNWLIFAAALPFVAGKRPQRPDVIIFSSPSLPAALSAIVLAKIFRVPFVFDIRDIWPLTLVQIGGFSPRHPAIRFMYWVEKRALAAAALVTSNLQGVEIYLLDRTAERIPFCHLPNGVVTLPEIIPASASSESFTIVYAGSIGAANNLDTLVEAAAMLPTTSKAAFRIIGSGDQAVALETAAQKKAPGRFTFVGRMSRAEVDAQLHDCDACIILWQDQQIYEYGIAANKIYHYMSAARPILHAFSGGYDPVAAYGAGLTVPADDPKELAAGILQLERMPASLRAELGQAGRSAIETHHLYPKIAGRLLRALSDQGHDDRTDPQGTSS